MPKVVAGLVCDDVRIEMSGKHTIVGVYTGDIIVPELPTQVVVSFWMEAKFEELGIHRVSFAIQKNDEKPIGYVRGTVNILDTSSPAPLDLPAANVEFEEPGRISLLVQFDDDSGWEEVVSKTVKLASGEEPIAG